MTDWKFDYHEVLKDDDGYWWHVLNRLESVDTDTRQYELADGTHTEYKTLNADDVEGWQDHDGMFDSTGWSTDTKPAAENGFRVNGALCEPESIEFWRGNDCLHEVECPRCGADGNGQIDIIHDIENREVQSSHYICGACSEQWSESYE